MTLTLHEHPFASYCWKALIALYERGVPFTPALVEGDEGRERLAELWPMAGMPVLVDDVRVYGVLDDRLAQYEWLAGDAFTLADCSAAPALFYARVVHDWSGRPQLTRYYGALRARPSVDRVIEEAREFRPLFPLPWPDDVD
jgi:glutathione S-transferase